MPILKSMTVRNFKCFRGLTEIDFSNATYLVGPNNSGKSAILQALRCFFDDTAFSPDLVNKTELTGKKEGFNRSDLSVTFDLNLVTGKTRQKRMTGVYGSDVKIEKSFTWREASDTVQVEYTINGDSYGFDDLNRDIQDLLGAVSLSYIHPQEGADLLAKAQDKFKQRLFHNWGRHASVAERVRDVQEQWERLRTTANSYLSSALSQRLRDIWPNAEVRVDLPDRIQDIVAISDITFRSSPNHPQITLPFQGTGAQSTILYQTHYILDSDRSLHQGMYFPIWLLEEPESFLHADIALQLSRLLSSDSWLDSIQMIISTHSPLILAGSNQASDRATWVVSRNHQIAWQKPVDSVSPYDIAEIGSMMGDSNFSVYFETATKGPRVFLEDQRDETKALFEQIGIPVTGMLGGVSNVKRYLEVLIGFGPGLPGETFFIVDSDEGKGDLKRFIDDSDLLKTENAWNLYELIEGCFLVCLPHGMAVEDLTEEWDLVLEEAVDDIFDSSFEIRRSIPRDLSRAVSEVRSKRPSDRYEAKVLLRKQKDVKDRFWDRASDLELSPEHAAAIKKLIFRNGTGSFAD